MSQELIRHAFNMRRKTSAQVIDRESEGRD